MKDRDLLMEALPVALGALTLAAIVHIVSIFAVPHLSTQDAWSRLAALSATNRFTLLDRDAHGGLPLPFEDPRTFVGVCRYDIANGPVRVQADFSSEGLVIVSFHDRRGATFYGLTDRGGLRGRLDALIVSQAQLEALDAETPDDEPVQELRLAAPTPEGFVIARSVMIDSTDADDARGRLASVTCTQPGAR